MKSVVGFDQLFDEFERISSFKHQTYPSYDIIKQSDSNYNINIALAGFSENEISAEVKEGILRISATPENGAKDDCSYIHQGIARRSFVREFRLADNIEVVNAEFSNGMLSIYLVKHVPEAEKPQKISIKSVKTISKKAA